LAEVSAEKLGGDRKGAFVTFEITPRQFIPILFCQHEEFQWVD
jgi:hypothetical protein